MRLALVLTAACSFQPHPAGSDAIVGDDGAASSDGSDGSGAGSDGSASLARKRRITVDPAQVTGDQPSFSMWFVIDGLAATSSGTDIYFTKPDGTPLPFEIQAWNAGHLEAWVLVDLADAAATLLDVRYGDAAVASAPSAAATFPAPFVAVWHLEDTLATTAIAESGHGVGGTALGNMPQAAHVGGALGSGIAFDGVDDEISFTNPVAGAGAHTFSAWVNIAAPTTGFSSILTVGDPTGNHARWMHTHFPHLAAGFFNGNDFKPTTGTIDVESGTPRLVHWVDDTQQSTFYVDGALVATSPTFTATNATQGTAGHIGNAPGAFGPGGNTPNPLHGIVDEVRIATGARSAGWIATEYANQHTPASFYTVGPDLPAP